MITTDINKLIPGKLYTAREYVIEKGSGNVALVYKYLPGIFLYQPDYYNSNGWFEFIQMYSFSENEPFMFVKVAHKRTPSTFVPDPTILGLSLPLILHKGVTGLLHDGSHEYTMVSK
jgi:hypothetical protein